MNKKIEFKKLWKIKVLRNIMKLDKELEADGTITRTIKSDNQKALNWAKYGFEEGIKFTQISLNETEDKE